MPSAPTSPENQATVLSSTSPSSSTSNQHGILPEDSQHHRSIFGGSDDAALPASPTERDGGRPHEIANDHAGRKEYGHEEKKAQASDAASGMNSLPASPELKGRSVQKKYKRPDANGKTFIGRLPNEVLSHALSFLDPGSLTSVSLVSRRFHALVTSPHAWKDAFARYFPQASGHTGSTAYPSSARYFTRLSGTGTHRSEYILRTQLLRSLKRGRPHIGTAFKPNHSHTSSNFSMITYSPKLNESTITHLHADLAKNRVIAASQYTGLYSYSDPRTGYVEVEQRLHPGYSSSGLLYLPSEGIGAIDVSESRGQIIGDGRESTPSFYVERAFGNQAPQRFTRAHGPDASITALWLAKKDTIVNTSGSAIVSASGSSKGVVQFQALFGWVSFCVCPGIPILDIRVDDGYTKARERRGRIWCIIINALGEVWYMKGKLPKKSAVRNEDVEYSSGEESTPWFCIPRTRKPNSPVGPGIEAPAGVLTLEYLQNLDTLMRTPPEVMAVQWDNHWRMDYFIEADFGGQNFIVGCKGFELTFNSAPRRPELGRYARILDNVREEATSEVFVKNVYGRGWHKEVEEFVPHPDYDPPELPDEWQHTGFQIPKNKGSEQVEITAYAIDMSNLALSSQNEDALVARSSMTPAKIPGHLSRLFAIGTSVGSIHIYNARNVYSEASLPPLHNIETDSPAISSLALSSLYLVHGGTDGLVQAWDPLASINEPIRAIHSRFSTRARRRLAQAASSVHGIGENQFAARAIFLDPDPTQLRGIVALGTHIRSWSFSSSVEKVSSNSNARRRKAAARRGSNSVVGKSRNHKSVTRGDIASEAEDLAYLRAADERRQERLAQRFGAGQSGMTEEEMVMYAMMISEESFERELEKHSSASSSGSNANSNSSGMGMGEEDVWVLSESPLESVSEASGWIPENEEENKSQSSGIIETEYEGLDNDAMLARALQDSFDLESGSTSPTLANVAIKFAKNKKRKSMGPAFTPGSGSPTASRGSPYPGTPGPSGSSTANRGSQRRQSRAGDEQFDRDLELAIQLSLKQ